MQTRTRLLMVALLGLWIGIANQGVVAARAFNPHVCEDFCPGGAGCDH